MKYIVFTLLLVSLLNVSLAVQAQEKLSSIAVIVKEKQYQKQHHDSAYKFNMDHKDAMHKVLINLRFMVDTEKFSKLENRGQPRQNWDGLASFTFFCQKSGHGVLYYKSDVL